MLSILTFNAALALQIDQKIVIVSRICKLQDGMLQNEIWNEGYLILIFKSYVKAKTECRL